MEIDYILTTKISNLKNVELINKVNGSDHHMIKGALHINLQYEGTKFSGQRSNHLKSSNTYLMNFKTP